MKYTLGSSVSKSNIPNLTYNWSSRNGAQPTLLTVANCIKVSSSGIEVDPSTISIA